MGGSEQKQVVLKRRWGEEPSAFTMNIPDILAEAQVIVDLNGGLELACIESLRAFCLFVCLFYLPAKPINNPSIKWRANGINSSTFAQMSAENEA